MTSVTPSRARSALVSGVALLLLLGAVGCDSGDDIGNQDAGSPPGHAAAAAEVTTVTTLQAVGKQLDAAHRTRLKAGVAAVIDPWFDGAFLGDFPRSNWSSAFSGFTQGAAADAQHRDLDLLTNAGIADQIESATATLRRVRLNVFAFQGHPRGVTAHFVLGFTTKGDLEEAVRVRGDLYLAKDKGEWKIFGYDVDQAEPA
ncbi:MAG TPA: hypothetical protein VFI19_01030 [Nocardioides sp.]|nr:hypothetical protein [Nocardioides sp.]